MTTTDDALRRLAAGHTAPVTPPTRKATRSDLLLLALGRPLPADVDPGTVTSA